MQTHPAVGQMRHASTTDFATTMEQLSEGAVQTRVGVILARNIADVVSGITEIMAKRNMS